MTSPTSLNSPAQPAQFRMLLVSFLSAANRSDERKPVGYLGRAGIMAARLRRFQDEHVREAGWFQRVAKDSSDREAAGS